MQLLESPRKKTRASPHVSVAFNLHAPDAKKVSLAGEFTNWIASAHPLKQRADGTWFTQVLLKPGRYAYKFVVDDQWHNDPASSATVADGFGGQNNLIEVKAK